MRPPKQTLSGKVLDDLGRDIVSGAHQAGTVLRIERLQQQFGVSRTVIRDAVRMLESLSLVATRRRVGVIVQPASAWNVFAPHVVRWRLDGGDSERQMSSFIELRAAVEPIAASLAALSAPTEVALRLVELTEAMSIAAAQADLDTFLDHDLAFHSAILQHSGNELFAALDEAVAQALRARHERNLMPPRPRTVPLLLHRLVAVAIRDRDPVTAESAMRQIVAEVQSVVERRLPKRDEEP